MTPTEYRQALSMVSLTPASKATAKALGVSVRTSQRYASGASPVPLIVQLRLSCLASDAEQMQRIMNMEMGRN